MKKVIIIPTIIPKSYDPILDIRETEIAIKKIKDIFERELAKALKLTRVSAPLYVFPETGLNDNLSGKERPVSFGIKDLADKEVEIVHSLAKWKRYALKKYGFHESEGLYTDMNAIRRDEELDNLHSIYVDQWDWEIIIRKEDRTIDMLKNVVQLIFGVFKKVEAAISSDYPALKTYLPDEIKFITSQELEDLYPTLSPEERENEITKKYGAVFLSNIGCMLKSGKSHDMRAPDYDDWNLNGDILFYYPILDRVFEVSSMGIRVDERTLLSQVKEAGKEERLKFSFHKDVMEKNLPYTIGGGLGQSRICMFFLNKAHIGEVQSSVWPDSMLEICSANNIRLL